MCGGKGVCVDVHSTQLCNIHHHSTGHSLWVYAFSYSLAYSVPGQPQDIHVEYTNTSTAVVLQWSGSQIRNDHVEIYHVIYMAVDEHMEGARNGTMVVNASQMHCLLSGLDEFREYSVMILGVNAVGHGAHSSPLTFQTHGKGM